MDMSLLLVAGGILALVFGADLFNGDDDNDSDNDNLPVVDDDDDDTPITDDDDDTPIVDDDDDTPIIDDSDDDDTPVNVNVTIEDGVANGDDGPNNIVQILGPNYQENFMLANGNGGNDTITMVSGGSAYGGAGDDHLIISDDMGRDESTLPPDELADLLEDDTISGGDGNDTLEVSSVTGTTIDGGDGDDLIIYEEKSVPGQPDGKSMYSFGKGNHIDTGDGNDTLDMSLQVGIDHSSVYAHLGEGVKTVNVDIDMDDIYIGSDPDEFYQFHSADRAMSLFGFDPGEDVLVIEIDTNPENTTSGFPGDAVLTYEGYTITESHGNTSIEFHYSDNLPPNPRNGMVGVDGVILRVLLVGVSDLPADAVEIIERQ